MSYSFIGVQVWHVLTSDHLVLPATHMFTYKWNEPYLPLTPAAERHRTLAGAHFPSTEGIGYWVGLGWQVKLRDPSLPERLEMSSS